ncbi:cytochrome C oxidase subunit IV family protein [Gordonia sp. CPCC 206044]|uniref:cytochrome C oxidase subunit IV family protein n=1 Tax=Gordonia sp. CPCC 206044 TaxID=3140793 RepID=UPI003AF3BC50
MTTTTTSPTRVASSSRAVTWTWAVLLAITAGSWWLAPAHHPATYRDGGVMITAAVLVITLVKSRLIIRYFMEVRCAPRWLRWATDAWLLVLCVTVFVIDIV